MVSNRQLHILYQIALNDKDRKVSDLSYPAMLADALYSNHHAQLRSIQALDAYKDLLDKGGNQ